MKFLLDTHILLWAASEPHRLLLGAKEVITQKENELYFSSASLWEIIIKKGLDRDDFKVDVHVLYRGLLDNGYQEIPVTCSHTLALDGLPQVHKDPFDRILVAHAISEGITLVTADPLMGKYPGPIRLV